MNSRYFPMKHTTTRLLVVPSILTAIIITTGGGCSHKDTSQNPRIERPGVETTHLPPDSARKGIDLQMPITKKEAIAIANKHFGRAISAGCYSEDRGEYFFVSPPHIMRKDSERAGIYIDKRTGEILEKDDKPFQKGVDLQIPITEKEAIAIADKHFAPSASSMPHAEDRGAYFFVKPLYKRRKDSERAGIYIDKRTGEILEKDDKPSGISKKAK